MLKVLLLTMNMKDTAILLIFLLAIVGLLVGIYYTEDFASENSHKSSYEKIYSDEDGVLTITLEKKENDDLGKYFT